MILEIGLKELLLKELLIWLHHKIGNKRKPKKEKTLSLHYAKEI
jgi:hypothetical protein